MTEDEKMKKYDNFFEEIKKFQEKQNKQKQRGLNDYNLLTAVLEPHDEVKLHSRMIGSLLNPDGLHYQNTLFLENLIDELKLDDFELDLENIYVGVEYRGIDIYITDGTKHIIIENKIWADDQPCQIIKYINIIVEENKSSFSYPQKNDTISKDLLRVIYLSPQNKVLPNEHVLNEEEYISFNADNITSLEKCSADMKYSGTIDFDLKNYKVKYKKIDYKDIFNWLQKCKHEVQNITNLNEAIRQYIDVVKIINKDYKGKVMKLDKYLAERKNFKIAGEIYENFPKVIAEKYNEVSQEIGIIFKNKFPEIKEIKALQIAANEHYINLLLDNDVIIQLRYRHYFKLSNIFVQYHLCKNMKALKSYNIPVHYDFKIKNFYDFLIDKDEIQRVCLEHEQNEILNSIFQEQIEKNKSI